ncbi:hypothetical protein ASD12_31655 [Mesorhizobium sp. Root102]|jgi:hypothetical protein|nr:hypothetical protein ASD12_31655 [Mesorhizobium sp. Root102]KRB25580.1 hypothetical protein ASE05_32340 [Mesorhizobium sp. Root172]
MGSDQLFGAMPFDLASASKTSLLGTPHAASATLERQARLRWTICSALFEPKRRLFGWTSTSTQCSSLRTAALDEHLAVRISIGGGG